jgi:hypothetical protein
MGRLIEIQTTQGLPPSLSVCVGDLLVFDASGGHVRSGADSVEFLGALMRSVVGENRQILAPLGAPNAAAFLARRTGAAEIDVIIGDPWHNPKTLVLALIVSQ